MESHHNEKGETLLAAVMSIFMVLLNLQCSLLAAVTQPASEARRTFFSQISFLLFNLTEPSLFRPSHSFQTLFPRMFCYDSLSQG